MNVLYLFLGRLVFWAFLTGVVGHGGWRLWHAEWFAFVRRRAQHAFLWALVGMGRPVARELD